MVTVHKSIFFPRHESNGTLDKATTHEQNASPAMKDKYSAWFHHLYAETKPIASKPLSWKLNQAMDSPNHNESSGNHRPRSRQNDCRLILKLHVAPCTMSTSMFLLPLAHALQYCSPVRRFGPLQNVWANYGPSTNLRSKDTTTWLKAALTIISMTHTKF